jgi:hypothetical protein
VTNELEPWITEEMRDVSSTSGIKVVHAQYLTACSEEPLAQVGTEKSGATCDENTFARVFHGECTNRMGFPVVIIC